MFGGFEVNLLPELKHLHDAGYNILTYDLRSHAQSGEPNGVISGFRASGVSVTTGLYSRCMGSNSTIIAMVK
jgi:hypothetical protein